LKKEGMSLEEIGREPEVAFILRGMRRCRIVGGRKEVMMLRQTTVGSKKLKTEHVENRIG
jgi:hypothetical protein